MSAYLSLIGRRRGGRLFEVGANSRLGAYSNKYGTRRPQPSKVTAAYRLQGGHVFERFMQSSHIWMEK